MCHACSLLWRSLMSTWALSRAPLTWSFILCGGSHSAATQLRVIPSCGPSYLRNASVMRVDSSGNVLLGRRLAWATSCLGDVFLLGDDSSWRWHISAITVYSVVEHAAFTHDDQVDFLTTYLSLVHVIISDDLVGTHQNYLDQWGFFKSTWPIEEPLEM